MISDSSTGRSADVPDRHLLRLGKGTLEFSKNDLTLLLASVWPYGPSMITLDGSLVPSPFGTVTDAKWHPAVQNGTDYPFWLSYGEM